MFSSIQRIFFNLKAQTAHGLHSPLVYDLYNRVINPNLGNFSKEKFLKDLLNYMESKIELKDFKLLTINKLEDFELTKINLNQILYIDQPYQNKKYYILTKQLSEEEKINYVIEFYWGTILIASNLAPKQVFYLKQMK